MPLAQLKGITIEAVCKTVFNKTLARIRKKRQDDSGIHHFDVYHFQQFIGFTAPKNLSLTSSSSPSPSSLFHHHTTIPERERDEQGFQQPRQQGPLQSVMLPAHLPPS
jgi:hypothetical protein